ncbi:MAG: hypothetical protein ACK4WF_03215, partial [Candidatus Brocadiales bacterium]
RAKKETTARQELQAFKKAIVGDPLATKWGSEATFGYIGDIGNLPASLQDLYTQPVGVPSFSFDATLGIGSGWRGPYVSEKPNPSTTDFLQDPFKNNYFYSTTVSTDATLGAEVWGTISSPGPNRIDNGGTQDDITTKILKTEILADVTGIIKNAEGSGVPTVGVTINFPRNGTLTSIPPVKTDTEGRYQFSDIPFGERAITLQPELVYVPGTAYAEGTAQTKVVFNVANLSSSNITVSYIQVYCAINPSAYFGEIWINGTLRSSLGARLVTTADTPVALSPSEVVTQSAVQREPYRLMLQSSRVEIPDIELTTIGAGEIITIEVRDFADAPSGGNPVSMEGIPFRVTFSNGSIATFTPKRR